jgi:hypothetical protein
MTSLLSLADVRRDLGSRIGQLRDHRHLLAAIGICPPAASSGYPETASFVTECDLWSWRGRAGNRLVRPGLAAVTIRAGSDADGESVLACVCSSFTGFSR